MKIYTHTQKNIENKKISFLENVKELKIYKLNVADPFKANTYYFSTVCTEI